jgi:hypothetical protein
LPNRPRGCAAQVSTQDCLLSTTWGNCSRGGWDVRFSADEPRRGWVEMSDLHSAINQQTQNSKRRTVRWHEMRFNRFYRYSAEVPPKPKQKNQGETSARDTAISPVSYSLSSPPSTSISSSSALLNLPRLALPVPPAPNPPSPPPSSSAPASKPAAPGSPCP